MFNEYTTIKLPYLLQRKLWLSAHAFRLSYAQAKYELSVLPELRSHVRSHIPGKVSCQSYNDIMYCHCLSVARLNESLNRNWMREACTCV